MSTNILLENDLIISSKRRFSDSTTHILDLNYDCLREIFQHLDLASQFSILKTSKNFFDIILCDIWYQYYDDAFDITKDQSIYFQTIEFQIELLKLTLKRFSRIKGIPVKIFNLHMENYLTHNNFEQITSLAINNPTIRDANNEILEMKLFLKFPNLQELHIENIKIKFDKIEHFNFKAIKNISLISYEVEGDTGGNFLKSIFSSNLEKLVMKPFAAFSLENFKQISQCVNLKELTLCTFHLNDARILEYILTLPSLEVLTLQSYDNFYFVPKDHTIFYDIMKVFYENPHKSLHAIEMNGMPDKFFFQCPYVQNITSLNWIATKIFHRKLDGSVNWKSDISHVMQCFYDFVGNSKHLKMLFVTDNVFHKKSAIKESGFVEKLQQHRCAKGYDKLKIVNNSRQDNKGQQLDNIPEGSVRFFIRNNNPMIN